MHQHLFTLHRNINLRVLALCVALNATTATAYAHATDAHDSAQTPPTALQLHVPSPDWRDQVIYFLMIDRFDDGDPDNNDQGAGEYDPADNAKYSGGDLKGVQRRLDYIRELGATTVWITPPVANQWWNPRVRYGGYHGYWAENLMQVDAHAGSLQDYRELSDALHRKGMYLVQDVVVNHMGDYFSYAGPWVEKDPAQNFTRTPDSRGRYAPTQAPFHLNDATDPAQRAAGIYHWTPAINDYKDPRQLLDFQMADLDDLDTRNTQVRQALRESYGYWIREVGVDGLRVDTAFYVPADYFDDFLHADDTQHPGILRVAAETGRTDFHVFGEGFGIDKPFQDVEARRIDSYMRDTDGRALLPGMVSFPLYGTLGDVFARGSPTAELAHRIESSMRLHANPHLMPTFVDNHDVDRFLAGGSQAGLKQALLMIMTLPGIPTLYYGTEQGFTEQRGAMFAQGYSSAGRDHFDTDAPLYRFIQESTGLRRKHRLFSRGMPTLLASNAAGPGALAYRMEHEGEAALVVFNSSDSPTLLDNLTTGAAPGTRLHGLFGMDGKPADMLVGLQGQVQLVLPARAGLVWKFADAGAVVAKTIDRELTLDALQASVVHGDLQVHGTATGSAPVQLVVDGDLDKAQQVIPDSKGRWQASIDTSDMLDATLEHRVVAWRDHENQAQRQASEPRSFRVQRDWELLAEMNDARNDDRGPKGRYTYPMDAGWRVERPQDIEKIRVLGSGGALKLELQMNKVIETWNPANGFDHVAFVIFLQLPDQPGGTKEMPLQNSRLPDAMRWHYRLRSHGWSNALFSHEAASATSEGTPVAPAATIETDKQRNTVTFTLPAKSLGSLKDLSGMKIHVTTWDYDGGFRKLAADAQTSVYGGGDGNKDPLVMDEVSIELP